MQVHAIEAAAPVNAIYTADSTALNGKHAGLFNLEEAKRLSQNGYGLCHDFVGRDKAFTGPGGSPITNAYYAWTVAILPFIHCPSYEIPTSQGGHDGR